MRSVDRLSVLLDLAKILHVDVEALIGRPWHFAPNGSTSVDGLDEIRRALARYSAITGDFDRGGERASVRELERRASLVHQRYQSGEYGFVIATLPDLLEAADCMRMTANGSRDSLLAYVSVYVACAKLLTKLGSGDLAAVAADRAAMVAGVTDSLDAQGMAIYQVICALLRADRTEEADSLAVKVGDRLTPYCRPDQPSLLSVTGALWLIAAIIAARRADRSEAWRRLDHADALAAMLGYDGNHAWAAFGPTNVAIHRVSVAAELGDPAGALAVAATIDVDQLPDGLRSRRAQVHLDVAWAQVQRKRDAEATLHLLEAEREAPESIRYNVMARETLREMLGRQRKKPSRTLTDLAARAGALE